ncbi:hypothetical protein SCOR_33845 [Sulfidibacter corallicola]|uniref:Uncharacterized protein n=1 Tax=Sulfidibacter corallicola TaxID=2818388 RepID=A0A8A4TKS2_SULCO|nr:hypothetical protein [Sulfidibacter corallicola]QTD49481.1 hypothetical protein J3U87_28175 [Sulfidibacter corallicola]
MSPPLPRTPLPSGLSKNPAHYLLKTPDTTSDTDLAHFASADFDVETRPHELLFRRHWTFPPAWVLSASLLGAASFGSAFLLTQPWRAAAVVLGLVLTYLSLAMWRNRTTLLIGCGVLSIRHRPFFWPGRHLYSCEVAGFFCREIRFLGKGSLQLCAKLTNGRTVTLISGLQHIEHVHRMIDLMREFLDVKNQFRRRAGYGVVRSQR